MTDRNANRTSLSKNTLSKHDGWTKPIRRVEPIVVSESTGVYRVLTSDEEYYVRTLDPEKAEEIDAVLERSVDFGFPSSCVIYGEPPLLVMESAPGRPLSRILPIVTLPVCWWMFNEAIRAAINDLGQYLGRLHRETCSRSRSLNETSFEKYRSEMNGIGDHLNPDVTAFLRRSADRIGPLELQCAAVHGDPTPHNLFYESGELTLIDFSIDDDAIVRDIVNAERGIDLMIGRLPYGRSSQRDVLLDQFRSGYRSAFPSFERPEEYAQLRCVSDAYILSLQLNESFDKPGAKIARRTDLKLLSSRINAVATSAGSKHA